MREIRLSGSNVIPGRVEDANPESRDSGLVLRTIPE
jgi:hypothetical protein